MASDQKMTLDTNLATAQRMRAKAEPVQNESVVGMMILPVEIRSEVYGYLLREHDPIRLEARPIPMHAADRGSGGSEICREYQGSLDKTRRRQYDPATKMWVRKEFKHASILLVNRQVHHEAEPVLYGKNVFRFLSTTILANFVWKIGPERARYLRHVQVQDYYNGTAKAAFNSLCAAKGLRTLEISHYSVCQAIAYGCGGRPLGLIAKDMAPLFKVLLESYQELRMGGSVWNILSLFEPRSHHSQRWNTNLSWHCDCSNLSEENSRLVEHLNQYVREHLKIKD